MPITYQGVSLFTEDEMVHVLGKLRKKNQVPTALNKFPSVKVNGKNYYSSSMMNRISELYLDYEEGFNLKNKPNRTTAENLRILDLNQKTITQHTDLNNYLKTDFVNDPIYNQLSDPVNKPTFAQNFLSMSYGKEKFTFSDLISGLITGTSDFKEKSMRLDKSYYDPRPSHSKSVEYLKQLIPDDPVRHTSSKDKPWWLYMNTGGFIPNKENSDFNKVFSGFSDLFSQSQKNQTKTNSLLENFGNSSKSSQYMASGGQLGNHPGDSKGSDTIPAWLSPNEYVINSASATANKSLLDKINQSKGPIYLAGGGAAASTMGQKTTGFVSDTFDTAQLAFRAAAGDPTAVLGLVTKQIGKMTENIQKQINAPFDLISGKSEKAGDALISVGNALGGPAGFFANVIGQSVESLRSWNAQLLQSNLQFAEFSGSMAQVAANQQIRDMEMSMARGERRAGIAEKQAKSSYELEKRLAVFEDALANVRGEVLTNLNKIATNAIDNLLEKLITDYHYFFLPILAWFSDKAGKDPGDMGLKGPYDDMSDAELIQRGWIRGNASGVEDASNVDIPERWRR